jgi:hypothetical protein
MVRRERNRANFAMLIGGLAGEDKKIGPTPSGSPKSATSHSIYEQEKYMQETADHVDRHVTAGVADKEMKAAKIDPAEQNSLNGEGLEVESAQIETESKGPTLRSRTVEYVQWLSATLVALATVSLLGVFVFVARVTSVFSGGRKSANRRWRK